MNIKITLSANAGVCLQFMTARIWVDVLHDQPVLGFSSVTNEMFDLLINSKTFEKPDGIITTHCHPDHFSRKYYQEIKKMWPETIMLTPERLFDQSKVIKGEEESLLINDVFIQFVRLPHEKNENETIDHYGLLLSEQGYTVLIPADCSIDKTAMSKIVKGRHINLALLPFPWVTLRKGREIINSIINPDRAIIYHLPFDEDDIYGYVPATKKSLEREFNSNWIMMNSPFQETIL